MSVLLRARGLTKRFGDVAALAGVDIEVERGEIHALLGENGAGKTTFVNLLFGMLRPDSGRIEWRGQAVELTSPRAALRLGIGMVHQHFMLVPALTVWENLWLSHPDRPRWNLDRHVAQRTVGELSERYGLGLEPTDRVGDLPVGARQRLEIAKALAGDARLLILDEPTAVLTPPEVEQLFQVLDRLRSAGKSILFISHKLDEVLRISDRITVLQRGKVRAHCRTEDADAPQLTRSIVGDASTVWARHPERRPASRTDLPAPPPAPVELPGEPRLVVRGLSGGPGRIPPRSVSFELRAGEIVGLTGVDGNGQEELVSLLAGVTAPTEGTIELAHEDVTALPVRARWRRGLAVLPGDRGGEGLVGEATVWENLALREFGEPWARSGSLVDPARHVARAQRLMSRHDVRASGPHAIARDLSGGNQQKLLFARELAGRAEVVVMLNPTRGLDVGAADGLRRELRELRQSGRALLLISTELDEVLALADRVAVLTGGRWTDVKKDRDAVAARMLAGAPVE